VFRSLAAIKCCNHPVVFAPLALDAEVRCWCELLQARGFCGAQPRDRLITVPPLGHHSGFRGGGGGGCGGGRGGGGWRWGEGGDRGLFFRFPARNVALLVHEPALACPSGRR